MRRTSWDTREETGTAEERRRPLRALLWPKPVLLRGALCSVELAECRLAKPQRSLFRTALLFRIFKLMNAKEGVEAWRALIAECMKEEIVNRQSPWTCYFRGLDGYEAREGKRGRHGGSRGVCVSLTEQKMGWEGKS